MRIYRHEDHRPMAWKNGGGTTWEVTRDSPQPQPEQPQPQPQPTEDRGGAGFAADFGWRASFAEIRASGPFSRFDGVDRIITLLEGPPVVLLVDGVERRLLPSEPFAFAGEADTSATVTGLSVDFNLMTRRDQYQATAVVLELKHESRVIEVAGEAQVLIVILRGAPTLCAADAVVALRGRDAASIDAGTVTLCGTSAVLLITLRQLRE